MRRSILRRPSRSARLAQGFASFAAVLLVVAALAFRFGLLQPLNWLLTTAVAYLLALCAALLALRGLHVLWREGAKAGMSSLMALLICLAMAVPLAAAGTLLVRLPMLNDLSTDLDDPVAFPLGSRVDPGKPLRAPLPRDDAAQAQRNAYPEVVTRRYDLPPRQVVRAVTAAARDLGWEPTSRAGSLDRDGSEARFAYQARTFMLRFEDDVVVRVRRLDDQELAVDIRSAGRFGAHDFGGHARRINRFYDVFEGHLRVMPQDETNG